MGAANLRAAPDHWVQASVQARGNGVTSPADSGQLAGPVASAGPVGWHGLTASNQWDSSISGSAAYGHLWGQGFATQAFDASVFPVQSDVSTHDAIQFFDTITLHSAKLPVGSPVTLQATLTLADDLSAGPTTCCANVIAHGTHDFSTLSASDQAGQGAHIAHSVSQTVQLLWFTGAANPVGGYLLVDAGSSPGCCFNTSGGSRFDLADTRFTLSLPAGVSLSSASGFDYAPPVPEPSVSVLLACGVAALARRLARAAG